MSTNQTDFPSAAGLIGNVGINRTTLPTIRSSIRRLNPDGVSNVPYYASITGKTLRLTYTTEPTLATTTINIAFSSNSLAQIITEINNAAPGVIEGFELDGFITVRNLNPGKTHFLTIVPFTTPASDAAPLLGFVVSPFPGSTSFAGEYSPSPPSRKELNPQTTALVAVDEDLNAKTFNRAFYALLQLVETMRADLARDVVVYKDVSLTFTAHAGDGLTAARINDDTLRLFYPEINLPTTTDLNSFYRIMTSSNDDALTNNQAQNAIEVSGLFYATGVTPFDTITGNPFTTWLTPDGKSIVTTTTINKTKHPSTTVSSIAGNIVFCTSATFVAHKIKAGDPVLFTASTKQPFDHTGWFAVDAVIDETHLAIRPMTIAEQTPVVGGYKPRWLNPTAGGTLEVRMGRFIPAGDIYVVTNGPTGTFKVRLPVGVPFHSTVVDDQARSFSGTLNSLAGLLYAHITSATAHTAANITYAGGGNWADGSSNPATTVEAELDKIISDLTSSTSSIGGSRKIGAEAISIGGATPNTISSGSIFSQLGSLLTTIRDHINQSSAAHAATAISYAGGGTWADTTTNPATTVEGQLDKIISDLASSTGSAKIGGAASGTDISAGTLAAQIADLAVNWLKMSRANTISGAQTFSNLFTATGGASIGGDAGSGIALIVGGQLISFVDFVYTADSTTNQITKTAHGLQTGDGPVRTSNVGGALPGGLAAATDYFVVNFDSNHFLLATSRTNALAGVTIDITTNGTGTQTLLHQPTTEREADATITRDFIVKGTTIATRSITVGVNNHVVISGTGKYKHGSRTLVIPARPSIQVGSTSLANMTEAVAGNVLLIPIPLLVGNVMTQIRVGITGANTTVFRASLITVDTVSGVLLVAFGDSDGTAAAQDVVINTSNQTIFNQQAYYITVARQSGAGTAAVYEAEIDYNQP